MRFHAALATVVCAFVPGWAGAEAPDPLRLIPAAVDAVAKVESPRALYDAIYGHEAVQDFLKIDAALAFYDTANVRRLLQVIAFLEKELAPNDARPAAKTGSFGYVDKRLDLLERLTGGGVVVAAQFEQKAVLVVVQAKDEDLLKRFVLLARKIIDQELTRQDVREKIVSRPYRGVETLHLGKEFHAARAGSALFLCNNESVLTNALDLHLDGGKNSLAGTASIAELRTHLPERPLVWGMLNLDQIKKINDVKNTLNTLGLDPITLFTIGGLVDVIKRSPYVCAGLAREGKNLHVRIAMPRGRDGMAPLAAMFLPEDERGSLPILTPPRVLSCTSYFLDLGKFWDNRHKILTPEQAKGIDQFEAQTGKYLRGLGLGTILKQAGNHHRIVTAIPNKSAYKIEPTVKTGTSFAVVLDMRDPAFAKSMNTVLRGAALVIGFQYGLKMVEEKHREHTLVTYYFPEGRKLDGDEGNIRFNFSPCFTPVGNQFVVSSSLELGKDLVDCLLKENTEGTSAATQRTHVYGTGLAANIRTAEDLLVSQTILSQALPTADAKKQLEELIHLVERLGQVNFETRYGPQEFRFDILWQYEKK